MQTNNSTFVCHPVVNRRVSIQAGAIGLLGLGMNHLDALQSAAEGSAPSAPKDQRS